MQNYAVKAMKNARFDANLRESVQRCKSLSGSTLRAFWRSSHPLWDQEVRGSNPLAPTLLNQKGFPMRMLMNVKIPNTAFNAAAKDGTAGEKLGRILEAIKPEAVYFTEQDGHPGAVVVVNVPDPSAIPAAG